MTPPRLRGQAQGPTMQPTDPPIEPPIAPDSDPIGDLVGDTGRDVGALESPGPADSGTGQQPTPAGRRLTELRAGDQGRLLAAHLATDDVALLDALGFGDQIPFRLCKAGNPCIVQVNGTRIGLSPNVARQLEVIVGESA